MLIQIELQLLTVLSFAKSSDTVVEPYNAVIISPIVRNSDEHYH
eukprot:UN15163